MNRGKTTATATRERHQVLKAMLEARRDEIQTKLRTRRETLPDEVAQVKDAEEQQDIERSDTFRRQVHHVDVEILDT